MYDTNLNDEIKLNLIVDIIVEIVLDEILNTSN